MCENIETRCLSLNDFRNVFQVIANDCDNLPLKPKLKDDLREELRHIQIECERLATIDEITCTLNRRGEDWYVDRNSVESIAIIDIYDMRQANRVYGITSVDDELKRLAYHLQEIFSIKDGDYLRRAPGSDEFKVISTTKSISQLTGILKDFHKRDRQNTLIPWDFGVGKTEKEAENKIQKYRKKYRPLVIRQSRPDSLLEISHIPLCSNPEISYENFRKLFRSFINRLSQLNEISPKTFTKFYDAVNDLQAFIEKVVTSDHLTGVLNSIGERWYLIERQIKIYGVAITDMDDMHYANIRYGVEAVDRDLSRFACVLLREFKTEDGFFVLRPIRRGGEFKVVLTLPKFNILRERLKKLHHKDRGKGLLTWSYGVGENNLEAHKELRKQVYHSIHIKTSHEKDIERNKIFFVAKFNEYENQDLFEIVKKVAKLCGGIPENDLHCTFQSIRNISEETLLYDKISDYLQKTEPFEIKFLNIARISGRSEKYGNFDRLWFLVKKTDILKSIYQGIANIVEDLGFGSYPYPVEKWIPHMKAVILRKNTPPIDANISYGTLLNLSLRVQHFHLTYEFSPNKWKTIYQLDL